MNISFISYSLDRILNCISHDEHTKIAEQIKEKIHLILSHKHILPQLNGFLGPFLPAEVKREVIELVHQQENIFLLKITYFTSYRYLSDLTLHNVGNSAFSETIILEDRVSKLS